MTIIRCPYCYLKGEIKHLAEIQPDGGIKILRMADGVDFTLIYSTEFQMSCGNCGNMVIYKTKIVPSIPTNVMAMWGTIMAFYEKSGNIGS